MSQLLRVLAGAPVALQQPNRAWPRPELIQERPIAQRASRTENGQLVASFGNRLLHFSAGLVQKLLQASKLVESDTGKCLGKRIKQRIPLADEAFAAQH